MPTGTRWTETVVEIAGSKMHLARAGSGRPVLVLHHDIGSPDRLAFYDELAGRFDVLVPHHPGYGKSERPQWLRSVRDVAAMHQWLLADLGVERPSLIGLGFGGWIAAEMATLAPRDLHRLVLVGAMGVKPPEGDIFDQAIVSYLDYARAGFHDQAGVRPDLRRCVDRPAGRLGHLPRDVLPHRLEALHVQPDPAASAGRGARAGAGRLGRRRQDRAAERRRALCGTAAATRGSRSCARCRALRRHGAARGARPARHRVRRSELATRPRRRKEETHACDVFHRAADVGLSGGYRARVRRTPR